MTEKCGNNNMTLGVKYYLETEAYRRQGLWAGRDGFKARHYKQKEIRVFHVEQLLFVLKGKAKMKVGSLRYGRDDRQPRAK